MKKILISSVLILLLGLSLSGCFNKRGNNTNTTEPAINAPSFPGADDNNNIKTGGSDEKQEELNVDKEKLDKLRGEIEGMDYEDLKALSE